MKKTLITLLSLISIGINAQETTLVAQYNNGKHYIPKAELYNNGLVAQEVYLFNGEKVIKPINSNSVVWYKREITNSTKFYIQNDNGSYLGGLNDNANVTLVTVKNSVQWVEETYNSYTCMSFSPSSSKTRTLLYSNGGTFKNYTRNNINATVNSITGSLPVRFLPLAPGYARETTTGNFGTICLPCAVAPEDRSGAKFYNITRLENEGANLILTEEMGSLVAGKPYIIKAEKDTVMCLFSGDSVKVVTQATGLVGNLSSTSLTVPQHAYIIYENYFSELSGATATVGQNRAYIDLSGVPGYNSQAKSINISISGETETSGIVLISASKNTSDKCYDIHGKRVSPTTKGILIRNKKKYFSK